MSYLNRSLSRMPIRLDMPRSGMRVTPHRFSSFNAGKLVPLFRPIEVLPGDTFDVRSGYVLRMSNPPIRPVMDKAYFDVFYFFVPMRLVWEHTKQFWGENDTTYWSPSTTYSIPQLVSPEGGFAAGSVADHLYSVEPGVDVGSFSALEARGYALIWNEWFRDQNYQSPAVVPKTDDTVTGSASLGDPVLTAYKGGALLNVNKYHDYFTSVLPAPQKAASGVNIAGSDILPVLSYSGRFGTDHDHLVSLQPAMTFYNDDIGVNQDPSTVYPLIQQTSSAANKRSTLFTDKDSGMSEGHIGDIGGPANLGLDPKFIANINQFRFAMQLQKFYERQALGGSRFRETLQAMYGATIPDATSQVPEYLGGSHQQIGVQQVLQTAASQSGTTPQGNTAAYSYTANGGKAFIKSFCEPGWIYVLGCVRTDHTYQQGLNRQFLRKDLTDFYNPLFANLGAQCVKQRELYAKKQSGYEDVIGYQEAWAEYRYIPNDVAGQMRSGVTGTLDSWHYADYYSDTPFIDGSFMAETSANVDRTLSVQSSEADQFILNIAFDIKMYRVMPLYSVPGLVDHH